MRKIGIMDLKREYPLIRKDAARHLKECIASHKWILGDKVGEFEKMVSAYLGAKHAVGVASGTDALLLALRAMAIARKGKSFFDKNDEIITTPFTFIATAGAIIHSGATPVLVDIDPDTFNLDPEAVRKAVNKNTVGIIPVHLYGLGCEMGRIARIAGENDLFIVEDNAQSFGGAYKSRRLGSFGDCGCHSFFPSKTLGGWGDGGLVATSDHELAELLKVLRNHGQTTAYNAQYPGYNSRLDSLQAAVLLAKLPHIDKLNDLRRIVADKYAKAFSLMEGVAPQKTGREFRHVYGLYTIKVAAGLRDRLLTHLNANNVEARIYYPVLLSEMKAFRGAKVSGKLAAAGDIAKRVLSIPMHPFLRDKEIKYIVKTIGSFFETV